MRPPICAICHKDFRKVLQKGGRVWFKLSPEDQAFNDRMTERKQVGHPKGLEWFCDKHLKIAERYKELSWKDARPKIIKDSKGWLRFWSFFKLK